MSSVVAPALPKRYTGRDRKRPLKALSAVTLIEEQDATRSQIHPRALEIIEATGMIVTPGKRDPAHRDFSPAWEGLLVEWWRALQRENPEAFYELIAICEEDFPTFCACLVRIYNKAVSRVTPFIWNNAQRIAWDTIARLISEGQTVFIAFLKARQLGVSTFVLAKHFWHAWRERLMRTTVTTHDVALAQTLISTISLFYDELPDLDYIKPKLRQASSGAKIPKKEVEFRTRGGRDWSSHILTHVAKNVEARGARAKHLLFSEYAFYDEAQALMDAITPQLPSIGSPARLECSIIIESTPNGQNDFYDLWQLAKSGRSEFVPVFLPWWLADDMYSVEAPQKWRMSSDESDLQKRLTVERLRIDGKPVTNAQMYWRRKEIDGKSGGVVDAEMAFDMEYPSDDETCFSIYKNDSIFKGDVRFLQESIAKMEDKGEALCAEMEWPRGTAGKGDLTFVDLQSPFEPARHKKKPTPLFEPDRHGTLLVWEAPASGHIYTMGSDSALTFDNSVTHVTCVTCRQQAAELVMNETGIEDFTDATVALGYWYNTALWLPEINYMGSTLLKRAMNEWMYPNMARYEKWDEPGLQQKKYGWEMNEHNKGILMNNMAYLIKERFYRIASRPLLSELLTMEIEGMTKHRNLMVSASGGKHDDRVVALALALKAVAQSPKLHAHMTRERYRLPTATDLNINANPEIERAKAKQHPLIAELLRATQEVSVMPSNPFDIDTY
jgi:hypothetical protein